MKIQVVNERDEIIGHKERGEIDPHVDIYRVSALWLTNPRGEVLLARRALTKDTNPGKWGPAVAGTVEENETYDSNIYKEAWEEIGLKDAPFEKGPKGRVTNPRNYFYQWYRATIDHPIESFTIQVDEVDAIRWFALDALKSDLKAHPELYVPAMAQILGDLGL